MRTKKNSVHYSEKSRGLSPGVLTMVGTALWPPRAPRDLIQISMLISTRTIIYTFRDCKDLQFWLDRDIFNHCCYTVFDVNYICVVFAVFMFVCVVSLQDILACTPFQSKVILDQEMLSKEKRPTAVHDTYTRVCDPPPRLSILTQYR